jgi:hypothetical protein
VKSFPFSFGGREYHLKKLDQDAKDDLLDRLTAGRLKQADRMFRKKLLTPAEYLSAKQGAYVKWGTEAFASELSDPANATAFIRSCLAETVDDAIVLAMASEASNPESDMALAVERMREDDDPKATTPPG